MAAQIDWTVPNPPVLIPVGGTLDPFAGYDFSVPTDGLVSVFMLTLYPLNFNGPLNGFSIATDGFGDLTLTGQASSIVAALQAGDVTYQAPQNAVANGDFTDGSAWIQTDLPHTDAVIGGGAASYTDPAAHGATANFFQIGQRVDLTAGDWQLSFSETISPGASGGYWGLPYFDVGWFIDSVGNNQDTNPQLPAFHAVGLGTQQVTLDFSLTSEVVDYLAFDGGNGDVSLTDVQLLPVTPVVLVATPLDTSAALTSTVADTISGSPACFVAGTRLLTPRGEVAVEALRPGDHVVTRAGVKPIAWIGQTRIAPDRHSAPDRVSPIRVQADAFGPGMPHRDVFLSPDHAVFVAGRLIPIHLLCNGATIRRTRHWRSVHYFHVELDTHAVLFAAGLPAESYLDTGNRAAFDQSGSTRVLHPDLSGTDPSAFALDVWARRACAPLCLEGTQLTALHRRLAARAELCGFHRVVDPGVSLIVDGTITSLQQSGALQWTAMLPPRAGRVVLHSRHILPRDNDPSSPDHRRLGVPVSSVDIDGTPVLLDDDFCVAGFHAPEQAAGQAWRWTDGEGVFALAPCAHARRIDIRTLDFGQRYWFDEKTEAPHGDAAMRNPSMRPRPA